MKRREFIAGLGGTAVAWPLAARAQQPTAASKRLAICSPSEPTALMYEHSDNRYCRALFAELRRLGHVEGQNLVIDAIDPYETFRFCAAASGRALSEST
jgi:putative ABC transport system substrate-binding protein